MISAVELLKTYLEINKEIIEANGKLQQNR
jgi:hypothetical protein